MEPKKGASLNEKTPPSDATVQYEGTVRAALAEGACVVDGAAVGAVVVGVVELGEVVAGADVVDVVDGGAVVVADAPAADGPVDVAVLDTPVVVSAPAIEAGTTVRPRTVAAAATVAARRARDVPCTGRELARVLIRSEVS
jgi:hypothetical protein